jgi:hypothetical protein
MSRCNCLTRYWIDVAGWIGYGVTAYSEAEALRLAQEAAELVGKDFTVISVTPDIDVRTLDEGHVRPNMGPPCNHGVWFPMFNV